MAQWVNAEEGKKWNLKLENEDGSKIDRDVNGRRHIRTKTIQFPYFDSQGDGIFERPIATRKVTLGWKKCVCSDSI